MKFFQMLVAGTMLVSSMVFAGMSHVGQYDVQINLEGQYARGLMATARFSDDPEAYIGCGVRHDLVDGVLISWAFCQASISPEIYVNCITYNVELVDKIAGLNHYSFIKFGWDEYGECTNFEFSTQSGQIPDKADMK